MDRNILFLEVILLRRGLIRKDDVERYVAYIHGLSQLPGYPRYNSDIITLFNCLQILPIENNAMLGASQLLVNFQGMHFNAKKALYIIFRSMIQFL